MSMGSASEVEYLVLLSRDLDFLEATNYERIAERVTEIKRMLSSLIQKLRAES